MKTARFAQVVEKCGNPEIYLAFLEPAKDRALQSAVKGNRVMTVYQESVGTKTDRGEVGFQAGRGRQFLLFPKSLRAYVNRTVVGIKYDLLSSREIPKAERALPTKPPRKKPKESRPAAAPTPKLTPPKAAKEPAKKPPIPDKSKVVPFKADPPKNEQDEDDEITELKKKVRHAMSVLEDGKAVAAFNLLKRIVED